MEYLLLLAFFVGALIESTLGFGGTIIAYSILSFFVDIKIGIFSALFIGSIVNIFVLSTGYKHIKKDIFRLILMAIPGLLFGAFFLKSISSDWLITLFGIFVIFISLTSFNLKRWFMIFNGFIHGILGTGGPLAVQVMEQEMGKKQLRANLALFFLSLNIIRGFQYFIQGTFDFSAISNIWWVPLPIIVAVLAGKRINKMIDERKFRIAIKYALSLMGLYFIVS
ncbi:MAG: sulfite exporter TauE/SafE family protein [Nanobdellota archaeon]